MMLALGGVLVTSTVVIVVLVMVADHAAAGTPRANAILDAVRTGLAAGGGAGAAVGLMLAFRHQYHQEIATVLSDYDATQRRITEMYGKAADQLGSAKAPVRLAGLYALERLALESPANREPIVNLLCAYLRMPYAVPLQAGPSASATTSGARPAGRSKPPHTERTQGRASVAADSDSGTPEEELQVRLAAQRILTAHLGAHGHDSGLRNAPGAQWPGLRIDLAGATLIDVDLSSALIDSVTFYGASFCGTAVFRNATFQNEANFALASFDSVGCHFDGATFLSDVYFGDTSFTAGCSHFKDATFHGAVRFGGISIQPEEIDLTGARVMNPSALLEWPAGWKVVPLRDGTGNLVRDTTP